MSTPVTHDSTALSEGDLATSPEPGEWRRQLIGLILGVVLAALVFWLFPSGAADTVANSPGAKADAEYSAQAMRVVAATTVLMAVWWMTEAIPLAATALLGLAYGLCLREGLLDVDEYTPPDKRGRVIGLYYVATYIGFGISPLIAWITPRVGPSLPFVVLAALAGCSALIRAAQIRRGYLVRGVVGS